MAMLSGDRRMCALVADDDRATAAILTGTLRRWQLDVVEAHDGLQAWDLLQGEPRPSLAIIDWMMPGLDGPELCRRIRQSEALASVHVILLTSRDDRADMVAGLDSGADDYIIKPFNIEELRARVRGGIRIVSLQQRLAAQVADLQAARDDLARLAATDVLTELASRRRWFEMAMHEFVRYTRYRHGFSVLMADLDFFKRINDTFGHGGGDEVLKAFGQIIRRQCRTSDIAGRIGGEEFAILLPDTAAERAYDVARRIVEACRPVAVETPLGTARFSCSIGVACIRPDDVAFESVFQRAAGALYAAKTSGRDRVEMEAPTIVRRAS